MKAKMMARCALFVSLMAVCAWIGLPLPPVRFTLQTLAVMTALGLLGAKWGAVSVTVYLLLGLGGLPVFSGFRGGLGAFLDPTGGFLMGMLLGALCYWAVEKCGKLPALLAFLTVCYGCGLLWSLLYFPDLRTAFLTCVAPYIIPEIVKVALALHIIKRINTRRGRSCYIMV